jgi:hypothetical protein
MRPAAAALVLAAALAAAGCGHGKRVLTPEEREACATYSARVTDPGTEDYRELVRQCLRNFLRPAGGGG